MADNGSVSGGQVSFTNQGTIDWTALAANIVQFSIKALARYSNAGVDTYTAAVGRLVSTQLQLSRSGRRNVEQGLVKLPCHSSYGNVLWFGFGIKHIIRELSSTDSGVVSVALCATLAECYHEDLAAEVLHEFVRCLKAPAQYTPSVVQCKTLIHACNGALAATDFGMLLEKMMALNPHAWYTDDYEFCGTKATRQSCASPESMANVLVALGAVTRNETASITVRGGNDAGWIAAISQWLFSLDVSIFSTEGRELYRSSTNGHDHVRILFEARSENSQSQDLKIANRVYVLEDATSIFRTRPLGGYVAASSGRVPWESLLSMTFGTDFEALMHDYGQVLATAVGLCARLFRGVVQADPNVPPTLIRSWSSYGSDSYGKGYINSITTYFQELLPLRQTMSQAAQTSFVEARARYEDQVAMIKLSCNCAICSPETKKVDDNEDKFCRLVLMETILALGHVLSQVCVQDHLYPKRLGIESFYRAQVQKRRFPPREFSPMERTDARGLLIRELGPFAYIYQDHSTASGDNEMMRCVELFTGYRYDEHRGHGLALSHNGICVYAGILHGLTDDPDVAGKLHVISGVIEHHEKPYVNASDSSQNFPTIRADIMQDLHLFRFATLKVVDTVSKLELFYELSTAGSSASQPNKKEIIRIKPQQLQVALSLALGWVACSLSLCPIVDLAALQVVNAGVGCREVTIARQKVMVFVGEPPGRLAAVYLLFEKGYKTVIQVNSHCLGCSLHATISGKMLSNYFSKVAPPTWRSSQRACLIVTQPPH